MVALAESDPLEHRIARWREYLYRRRAIHTNDVAELGDHLREQIDSLVDAGLAPDEAFLVAVKRLGDVDSISREYAIEHSDRLWKQLVLTGTGTEDAERAQARHAFTAIGFALAAAMAVKLPVLFGKNLYGDGEFYARNAAVLILPVLTAWFAWNRRLSWRTCTWLVMAVMLAAIVANVFPYERGSSTEILTALHLPIALWAVPGIAYAGNRWRLVEGRMDFVRFTGELVIYSALIAIGVGVLMGFMAMTFQSIGLDVEPFFESWLLPCAAASTIVIASWLVESKQSVIENMAPVLTRLFTPLFAIMQVTFLVTMLVSGRGIAIDRDVLIAFDLLLLVVLALLLYAISARDPRSPPDLFDVMQLVLVVSAMLADAVALWAVADRITEFGISPNRLAALGVNAILLVNLGWSAVLSWRFLRRVAPFTLLERWQMHYVPVYVGWAAIVVIVFPIVFGFR